MQDKYTLEQAAAELMVPPRRLREMAAAGKIGHVRIGRRDWIFTRADLDDFLARHRFEPRTVFASKAKKAAAR